MMDTARLEKFIEGSGDVFTAIVAAQCLDAFARLIFRESLEFSKFLEDFILGPEKIDERLPGLVINVGKKVLRPAVRHLLHRSAHIGVHQLENVRCSFATVG
jgi:hypothetical protein